MDLEKYNHLEEIDTDKNIKEITEFLNKSIENYKNIDLGKVDIKNIETILSDGKYERYFEYKIKYPSIIVKSLVDLYQEYNNAFKVLIEKNREWETDYQYCLDENNSPINYGIQIDMIALPEEFINYCQDKNPPKNVIKEVLRHKIFELENSLAMYDLSQSIFEDSEKKSNIRTGFREMLDAIRKKTGKKIILLAVTEGKFYGMLSTEFGKTEKGILKEEEVQKRTGFDNFWGPDDFLQHLRENKGNCNVLLYVRSSDSIEKLKKPDLKIPNPLLEDEGIRKQIKANTITLNIDNPTDNNYSHKINDTKEYMLYMDMCFLCNSKEDILHEKYLQYLQLSKSKNQYQGPYFNDKFVQYLLKNNISLEQIQKGNVILRAKPEKGTYGCYGHARGKVTDADKFRKPFFDGLKKRGNYVIQVEMPVLKIKNNQTDETFISMDRNFLTTGKNGEIHFCGLRFLEDESSPEAKKGNIHGSKYMRVAEIS